ncbi:unnamed protein product [Phaedon cochleariae]|uniref:Ig-like domain-containing protein n=1 Tax=Phaedon cochleariae TaxID=80249 RepID=A0A9N9SDN1_PHACE|nr:unnamed protein product [Phaedon cochleariae]
MRDLKKQFEVNPESTHLVEIGHQVDLKCVPPTGMPPPRVYWLRGGQMLQSDTDVLVTSEGHLLIGQARPQDTGNYTCVAENIAAKRTAAASQIVVYEMGDYPPHEITLGTRLQGILNLGAVISVEKSAT